MKFSKIRAANRERHRVKRNRRRRSIWKVMNQKNAPVSYLTRRSPRRRKLDAIGSSLAGFFSSIAERVTDRMRRSEAAKKGAAARRAKKEAAA